LQYIAIMEYRMEKDKAKIRKKSECLSRRRIFWKPC